MGKYYFKTDIVEGLEGEKVVKDFLTNKGMEFISSNDDNKYDLLFKKKNKFVTYEIKTDTFVTKDNDTKNIFIEYETRNKKSGLSVTEADWFVYFYFNLNELWFIKTEKLKKLINHKLVRTVNNSGDPNSNTKGYLIPRISLKKNFMVYDIT